MGEKALRGAVTLALVELAFQEAALIDRGAAGGAPLRLVFLASKVPVALLALKRKPGAYLVLWVYEVAGLAAILDLPRSRGVRLGFGVVAIVVMVLLGRAASAFPPVEWKSR